MLISAWDPTFFPPPPTQHPNPISYKDSLDQTKICILHDLHHLNKNILFILQMWISEPILINAFQIKWWETVSKLQCECYSNIKCSLFWIAQTIAISSSLLFFKWGQTCKWKSSSLKSQWLVEPLSCASQIHLLYKQPSLLPPSQGDILPYSHILIRFSFRVCRCKSLVLALSVRSLMIWYEVNDD